MWLVFVFGFAALLFVGILWAIISLVGQQWWTLLHRVLTEAFTIDDVYFQRKIEVEIARHKIRERRIRLLDESEERHARQL